MAGSGFSNAIPARLFKASNLPAFLIALLIGTPILAACLGGVFLGGGEAWQLILETRLSVYFSSTLIVLFLCAVLMLLMAIPAAWLVTMYDFPGRRVFDWVLILPLAAPGYVIAYAYGDLLGVFGPVQSLLRDLTGWSARDYWFPNIYSPFGCAFVLAVCLYPYVYLTARSAFLTQSVCTLEAARSLGANSRRVFLDVALPGARPAIAAGLGLALMEAAADYGAADFLGVNTLTVGLVRAWSSFYDAAAAARFSIFLIFLALILRWVEQWGRGNAGVQASSIRWRTQSRTPLSKGASIAACLFCGLLLTLGFGLPVARLIWMALDHQDRIAALWSPVLNSVLLAALGAAFAFLVAVLIAFSLREGGVGARLARLMAAAGYAMPGAVLAAGGLIIIQIGSLSLTGAIAFALLIWAYASRFSSAGAEPITAALKRAPHSLGYAAASLGAGPVRRAWLVDRPIALSGAAVGALILFVEILKELPATMMLRPTGWDTLAVRAHIYASDERLAAAAAPSVLITLVGLGPIVLLCLQLARARPGAVS